MSYINKKLTTEEELIDVAKLHWLVILKPVFHLICLGVVWSIVEEYRLFDSLPKVFVQNKSVVYLGLFVVLVVFPFIGALIKITTTEMAITNQRLLSKRGFIAVEMQGMPLSKIENIDSSQSILGRLFGYGNVIVKGSGSTPIQFVGISKPMDFRNTLAAQIDNRE